MSLTIAFKVAQKGLSLTESKLSVVSSNINNAGVTGYTRKAYQGLYVTAESTTSPIGGSIVQATVDDALTKQLNKQSTTYFYEKTLADYVGRYSDSYGSTSSDSTTLSAAVDNFTAALQALEENPTEDAAKAAVVNSAQQVAVQLNNVSQAIQDERLQANNAIGTSIEAINASLKNIAELNLRITQASTNGTSPADLIDQRNSSLQTLTQQMGVQYFIDDNDQLKVFTSQGDLLVSGNYTASLTYEPTGSVSSSTVYPGGFPPITLNGTDITGRLKTGTLGALISLRDTVLTGEQAKLDTFASILSSTLNTELNKGASVPPPSTLTGNTVLDPAAPLGGSGNWRIAVTDLNGVVQAYVDFDLSSYATVGDLVAAINGGAGLGGVSASLNSSGNLVITATAPNTGIAMNEMTSSIGSTGASNYLGLNNLFVGTNGLPVSASNIKVSAALAGDSSILSTGLFSSSVSLTTGDYGISSGDISTTSAMLAQMNGSQTFAAAGSFASRTTTLSSYANAIIAGAASQASASNAKSDTANATYSYLSTKLSNETGVNVDEETANMTSLQTNYQATATLMATIRDMFKTLISIVNQ